MLDISTRFKLIRYRIVKKLSKLREVYRLSFGSFYDLKALASSALKPLIRFYDDEKLNWLKTKSLPTDEETVIATETPASEDDDNDEQPLAIFKH
uniref:Uncharacterized protein n=1 Tax=Romanomermis culicivorax TaxID=13658 RepID=A0A915JE78_ROMCU